MSLPTPGSDQPHHDESGYGEHPDGQPRPHQREAPAPVRAPVPAPRPRPGPFDPERARPSGSAGPPADDRGGESDDLVAAGVVDMAPGDPPAPVSIWQATTADAAPAPQASVVTGLNPRVAGLLLEIWTDPGELIIDTTGDPAVQQAADSRARPYLAFAAPSSAPQSTSPRARAALILLRCPTAGHAHPTAVAGAEPDAKTSALHHVLAACRELLSPDGHAVVLLTPPVNGRYRDLAANIVAAAHSAGLGPLKHLVAVTSDAEPPAPAPPIRAHSHIDLLALVIAGRL
jgi:hypothetical protein